MIPRQTGRLDGRRQTLPRKRQQQADRQAEGRTQDRHSCCLHSRCADNQRLLPRRLPVSQSVCVLQQPVRVRVRVRALLCSAHSRQSVCVLQQPVCQPVRSAVHRRRYSRQSLPSYLPSSFPLPSPSPLLPLPPPLHLLIAPPPPRHCPLPAFPPRCPPVPRSDSESGEHMQHTDLPQGLLVVLLSSPEPSLGCPCRPSACGRGRVSHGDRSLSDIP